MPPEVRAADRRPTPCSTAAMRSRSVEPDTSRPCSARAGTTSESAESSLACAEPSLPALASSTAAARASSRTTRARSTATRRRDSFVTPDTAAATGPAAGEDGGAPRLGSALRRRALAITSAGAVATASKKDTHTSTCTPLGPAKVPAAPPAPDACFPEGSVGSPGVATFVASVGAGVPLPARMSEAPAGRLPASPPGFAPGVGVGDLGRTSARLRRMGTRHVSPACMSSSHASQRAPDEDGASPRSPCRYVCLFKSPASFLPPQMRCTDGE
mmetsp:Transcript_24447/g.66400  ORF Transcript_24447/g.66400 Transcript_24447/m.66400 type:complete len:272 (-) Transcript_24447:472-1287(-)